MEWQDWLVDDRATQDTLLAEDDELDHRRELLAERHARAQRSREAHPDRAPPEGKPDHARGSQRLSTASAASGCGRSRCAPSRSCRRRSAAWRRRAPPRLPRRRSQPMSLTRRLSAVRSRLPDQSGPQRVRRGRPWSRAATGRRRSCASAPVHFSRVVELEDDALVGRRDQPAVLLDLGVELARRPAGIAEREHLLPAALRRRRWRAARRPSPSARSPRRSSACSRGRSRPSAGRSRGCSRPVRRHAP